jgi:transposase
LGPVIPGELRILVCTEPLDMRLGFDRLAAAVRERLGADPLSGGLYIFANRGATRLKLLWFDRNGYCLLYKRLHRAVFNLPITRDGSCAVRIDRAAVATLLAGVERPRRIKRSRGHTLH